MRPPEDLNASALRGAALCLRPVDCCFAVRQHIALGAPVSRESHPRDRLVGSRAELKTAAAVGEQLEQRLRSMPVKAMASGFVRRKRKEDNQRENASYRKQEGQSRSMIHSYPDRHTFGHRHNELVFPAQPVQTIEHLHGRTRELELIEKALFAPGRHVFIYGDRGVGKSSRAAAAASPYQSADATYIDIDIGCGPDATLSSVIANIALQALADSRLKSRKAFNKAGLSWRFLNLERSVEEVSRDLRSGKRRFEKL